MVSPLNTCTATLAGALSASLLPLRSERVWVLGREEGGERLQEWIVLTQQRQRCIAIRAVMLVLESILIIGS